MASALAIEIAELMGWTAIKPGIRLGSATTGIPPHKIYQYRLKVPQPDKDPAAAFDLLEYLASQRDVKDIQANKGQQMYQCWITLLPAEQVIYSKGQTLAEAVALVGRDALRAIKGEEATG